MFVGITLEFETPMRILWSIKSENSEYNRAKLQLILSIVIGAIL